LNVTPKYSGNNTPNAIRASDTNETVKATHTLHRPNFQLNSFEIYDKKKLQYASHSELLENTGAFYSPQKAKIPSPSIPTSTQQSRTSPNRISIHIREPDQTLQLSPVSDLASRRESQAATLVKDVDSPLARCQIGFNGHFEIGPSEEVPYENEEFLASRSYLNPFRGSQNTPNHEPAILLNVQSEGIVSKFNGHEPAAFARNFDSFGP